MGHGGALHLRTYAHVIESVSGQRYADLDALIVAEGSDVPKKSETSIQRIQQPVDGHEIPANLEVGDPGLEPGTSSLSENGRVLHPVSTRRQNACTDSDSALTRHDATPLHASSWAAHLLPKGRPEPTWFGRPAPAAALAANRRTSSASSPRNRLPCRTRVESRNHEKAEPRRRASDRRSWHGARAWAARPCRSGIRRPCAR
jgi:hypothetical protein